MLMDNTTNLVASVASTAYNAPFDDNSDRECYKLLSYDSLSDVTCNQLLKTALTFTLFFWIGGVASTSANASNLIDLQVVAKIESSGNPSAISKDGSYGLHQVTQGVVDDYNRTHNTSYLLQDALDETISGDLAGWYLNEEIPRLLKHYRKPLTVENLIIAYNCGIGCVVKGRIPPVTKRYIAKYRKLSGVQRGLIYPLDNPADQKYRVSPQLNKGKLKKTKKK